MKPVNARNYARAVGVPMAIALIPALLLLGFVGLASVLWRWYDRGHDACPDPDDA